VEVPGGFGLDLGENALALVHVHVGNAGVQAESVVIAAERPDVNVVNFVDAVDGEHSARYIFHAAVLRSTFQEHVRGFAQDADAGPQHQDADGETQERVNPAQTGGADHQRADDNGDVGEGVAEIVYQNAAQVQVAASAHQSESDSTVYGQRGERRPDHPAFDDDDGRAKTFKGFVAEPQGKKHEDDGVGEGGESSGAMIAVGFFGVGGTLGPAHGEIGNADGGNVGEIVDGVVEQRDAAAQNAAKA